MKSKDEMMIDEGFAEYRETRGAYKQNPECPMCSDLSHGFKAGVAWRDKNPPPSVDADEALNAKLESYFKYSSLTAEQKGELLPAMLAAKRFFQAGQALERVKVQGLVAEIKKAREQMQEAVDGTSSAVDDMQHYFENKCVPILDEVNSMASADSHLRYAIGVIVQALAAFESESERG